MERRKETRKLCVICQSCNAATVVEHSWCHGEQCRCENPDGICYRVEKSYLLLNAVCTTAEFAGHCVIVLDAIQSRINLFTYKMLAF